MPLDLSFKQVCEFIKKDDPTLIEDVDKLLGLLLVCSPIVVGPAAAAFLPLIAVKNELIKLGKGVFEAFSEKKDDDYVARQQRMEIAYGLICFTAFFEALDRQIPKEFRTKIGLLKGEKTFLARKARAKAVCPPETSEERSVTLAASSPLAGLTMSFPHPTETLAQQLDRHAELWKQMGQGFGELVQKLAFWEDAEENERAQVLKAVQKIPQLAAECFQAQYFELARRYEDFAVWANLQEHKKTKALIGTLSTYVRRHAALVKSAKTAIDIGFAKMRVAVSSIPETLKISQATDIVESLRRHYDARAAEPIAPDKGEANGGKPHLRFPRIRDAFIPQSFRVLRWTSKIRSLEDEATWKELERRDDLGAFLLSFLSSPYSTDTPLVILGHPGSGKSVLTVVLSAQLMSQHYTAIRVPLREVNADAGVVGQIEERIRQIASVGVDSWAKLSGAFKNSPPLVILDGYDELLQASGKVFSAYLKDVQTFQKNEAEQGRPVRVVVTSRVTLIDKATIPPGATIVRLLEFNKRQRDRWIVIWNRENTHYFSQANVKEFALPRENEDGAVKVLSLAEQPLLLLMLALYDSQENQLRKSKSLDRTFLYENLLRRFVTREREKDPKFDELAAPEQKKELDTEMQRLAVAALGMYNRRKLHILSPELNDDIKFFNLERPVSVNAGRPLTQADLLLGSFFFVHKSKAQLKAGAPDQHEETAAFEFLHNTFGEFLTADFILRQSFSEVTTLKALRQNEDLVSQLQHRLGAADGPSREWFASLIYTPLFTRPVVMEMIREWVGHWLKHKQLSMQAFLSQLDGIVLNHIKRLLTKREMPSIMYKETAQEGYRAPFGDHPLLGHIAIYSLNLVLLRIVVSAEPFVFEEGQIGTHEDGARPWDRLTHLWRSWFSLDNLNGVTAVMLAERKESQITVRAKEKFQVAESQDRLETCLNVGVSLADNISSGFAGLLLFDPSDDNRLGIEDIARRLESEKIDVEFQIAMKRLLQIEGGRNPPNAHEFAIAFRVTLEMALREHDYDQLEQICVSFRRALRRLRYGHSGGVRSIHMAFEPIREALTPEMAAEVVRRRPQAGLLLFRALKEMPSSEWKHHVDRLMVEALARRDPIEVMHGDPDAWTAWWEMVREMGPWGVFERYGPAGYHGFIERALDRRRLLELSEHNPETASAWLQLARKAWGVDFLRPLQAELFERVFPPNRLLELGGRNPEAALAWVQLGQEVSGGDFLRRLGPDFFERVLHPLQVLELGEHNPEAVLAWLQLAQQVGGKDLDRRLGGRFLEIALHPNYLLALSERSPEAAAALLQFVGQVAGEHLLKNIEPAYFEGAFHPRVALELGHRNPEVALMWLQICRQVGGGRSFRDAELELFNQVLNADYFTSLLTRRPGAFAAILRFVRATEEDRVVDAMLTSLSSICQPDGGKSALERLPLSALPDLQWLADQTPDDKRAQPFREWFRESGLDQRA
jgi:hypothetical protein